MMDKKKKRLWALIGMILLVLGIFGLLWFKYPGWQEAYPLGEIEQGAEQWTGERREDVKASEEMIAIPGYDSLQLKANTTEQAVNLYNPEENTCYFKISLWQDADTKIWESKLIEPGKAIYQLTLAKSLPAGTYDQAFIKYECFSLEKQEPLNGSEIHLVLNMTE